MNKHRDTTDAWRSAHARIDTPFGILVMDIAHITIKPGQSIAAIERRLGRDHDGLVTLVVSNV